MIILQVFLNYLAWKIHMWGNKIKTKSNSPEIQLRKVLRFPNCFDHGLGQLLTMETLYRESQQVSSSGASH